VLVEEIKAVIESQRAELEEKFRKERILPREGLERAEKFLNYPNILAVLGVRRCGKSIFSVLLSKRVGPEFCHINFDDERLVGMRAEDLDKVLQAFYELYGRVDLIILDEPQNVPRWELFANRLRRTKRVIVTGSNSQLLAGELATAITGRHVDFFLFTFSFREVLGFKPNFYLTEDVGRVRRELDRYLRGSGFPEYLKFGPEIVRTIYEDVINKDCIRRYRIRAESGFRELARYLVSNFGSEFTYSRLRKLVGIKDVHTVRNYVSYLRQAFLLHVLERFSFKLKQQVLAPKKVYVADHGLANFVGFRGGRELGRLYENVVCVELLRRASRSYGTEVYYWKDHRGREVDFVVKRGGRVKQLVQVCYDLSELNTRRREFGALVEAARELKCRELLVVTAEEWGEEKVDGKRVRLVPLWRWLLEGGEGRTARPRAG
jgi:hypothetical protein